MDKKTQKKKMGKLEKQLIILAIVLVLIFAVSVASYYIFKPKPYFEYDGFKIFKKRLEGTSVDFYYIAFKMVDGPINQFAMRNDPRTLEDIPMNVKESLWTGISKLWVSSDPTMSYVEIPAGEVGRFGIAIGLNTSYAFNSNAGSYNLITCNDSTKEVRVVDIRIGNETKIYSEGNCIIIEGKDDTEMSRAADKLVMTWLKRLALLK